MGRVVVLLSGGLDSATVLAMARAEGNECFALTVSYGQRHSHEIRAASQVAGALGAFEHKVISVPLNEIGGSALTDAIAVPRHPDIASIPADIPVTYVPARNTVLLSMALAYAEVVGADEIHVGVNAVDYSGYPDCRPEFVEAFERLANVATKSAIEGKHMKIVAPLLQMTKAEIISRGLSLGVDFGMTHSCYDPGPDGLACGRCASCLLRCTAFASLGLEDPALGRGAS